MATRNYRIGGYATDIPGDIKFLWARNSGTNLASVFWDRGSVAYKSPDGKAFYITKIVIVPQTTASSLHLSKIGYADNYLGDGFDEDPGSLTNSVNIFGEMQSSANDGLVYNPAVAYAQNVSELNKAFSNVFIPAIPASTPGKYLWTRWTGGTPGSGLNVWGIEL